MKPHKNQTNYYKVYSQIHYVCRLIPTNDCPKIFYVIKSNPTPPTPIIHEHKIVHNIIQPPKRVLVEKKICTRIDGCPEKNATCPTCVIDKVWE